MPNSEDYTVVWAGVCQELRPSEVDEAERGSHPMMQSARSAGLDVWFDTFDTTPQGEAIFHLLIGARLGVLGYKEGRSRLSSSMPELMAVLDRVDAGLRTMGLRDRAELHVLLRIEA